MCGITGLCYRSRDRLVPVDLLDRMTDTLVHRGPDDHGRYTDGNVGLGFRRLSILDLSPSGHQPMSNEDGSIWLVFNGEIYNFQELRRELLGKSHSFRSQSDTEVILHGYEEWGEGVLQHLNGMFALALWDRRTRRLLLVRDRFGIKPLHYALLPEGLVFASEIKALLACPAVPRHLDYNAFWNYLSFAQIPAPKTAYIAIRKLLPGHLLEYHEGQASIRRYYRLPKTLQMERRIESLAEQMRGLLSDAVRSHLVADVPVGCFLSGGIDSSLIAALAARHCSGPVRTFSARFPEDPAQDESRYQDILVRHIGADHHVMDARTDLVEELPHILAATDEPFAISSFLPLVHVARLAAKHVKVVLSGDGSDELFAGYAPRYLTHRQRLWLGRYPPPSIRATELSGTVWQNRRWLCRWRRRHAWAQLPESHRYITANDWFSEIGKQALLQPEVLDLLLKDFGPWIDQAYDMSEADPLRRQMLFEMQTSLPDEMLTKADRATSAVSTEARVPFLDLPLVESAWAIDPRVNWKNRNGKIVLKKAARGLIPDVIIDRPKTGFTVPLSRWIRENRRFLRPELLQPCDRFREIVRPDAIRAMFEAHDNHSGDHGERLWVLYVLNRWLEQYPAA